MQQLQKATKPTAAAARAINSGITAEAEFEKDFVILFHCVSLRKPPTNEQGSTAQSQPPGYRCVQLSFYRNQEMPYVNGSEVPSPNASGAVMHNTAWRDFVSACGSSALWTSAPELVVQVTTRQSAAAFCEGLYKATKETLS